MFETLAEKISEVKCPETHSTSVNYGERRIYLHATLG